jgi:hypothetical protein
MTNNFIINSDTILEGYDFESSLNELIISIDLLESDEYVVNWRESDMEIHIDSIEADNIVIWENDLVDDWNDKHDNLVEGLMGYIENTILDAAWTI